MIEKLLETISPNIEKLNQHMIYSRLRNVDDLKFFMERHVFAVLDFMSLAKALQNHFAPSHSYWTPPKKPKLARFINEVVLGEESDLLFGDESKPMSHFEIYIMAMDEVGANTLPINHFLSGMNDIELSLSTQKMSMSCKKFMAENFSVLKENKLHEIAAYFCFGREKIIPGLFQSILDQSEIVMSEVPIFKFYLERHIEVDGDHHGPIALEMIKEICGDDQLLWAETIEAANNAVLGRISFWDDITDELSNGDRLESLNLS